MDMMTMRNNKSNNIINSIIDASMYCFIAQVGLISLRAYLLFQKERKKKR